MFRGSGTYFLVQERVAADRRARSDELVALYGGEDALPDAADRTDASTSTRSFAGLSFSLRQLVARRRPHAPR